MPIENIDSANPEKHWLLWASLKATGLGFACFFPAFFLSLLITIPWSKHYWAGEPPGFIRYLTGGKIGHYLFGTY